MALKFSWVVAALLAAGCSERRFVMTLESTDGTRASGSTRAHWSLFGTNDLVADGIGSLLAEGSEAFDEFPAKLKIQIPRYPHKRVGGGVDKEDAVYWFSVRVDIDGDGQFCGGEDMFEDWADFNDMFMHEKIPRRRDIPMAKLPADHGCQEAEP